MSPGRGRREGGRKDREEDRHVAAHATILVCAYVRVCVCVKIEATRRKVPVTLKQQYTVTYSSISDPFNQLYSHNYNPVPIRLILGTYSHFERSFNN